MSGEYHLWGSKIYVTTKHYYAPVGKKEEAAKEYERFQGCLLQLIDDESIVGDLEDQWVIFKNGWVYGLSSFSSQHDATAFAGQIFRDEPDATYIIVQVDIEAHTISAMHLLGSALSDVEAYEIRQKKAAEELEAAE